MWFGQSRSIVIVWEACFGVDKSCNEQLIKAYFCQYTNHHYNIPKFIIKYFSIQYLKLY